MSGFTDPVSRQALESLAAGIAVGHRLIAPGDEAALLDEEGRSIVSTVVARDLLARLGHPACVVTKTAVGRPRRGCVYR